MYVKVTDGIPEKYTLRQLILDNPNTSFPTTPDEIVLAEFDVYPLKSAPKPSVDFTKVVSEGDPQLVEGEWVQNWIVSDATEDEVAANKLNIKNEIQNRRRKDYTNEADPLFFKWQRGEVDEQTYINKVDEIRARHPYPDGIE